MEKISFPFVTGIALGACLTGGGEHAAPFASALSLLICYVLIILIIRLEHNDLLYPVLFISLGLFCSFSASLSLDDGSGIRLFERAAGSFRQLVRGIPYRKDRSNALVCALLIGDRSALGADITRVFRDSGASHILALSGLHLGFIYLVAKKATALLGNSRFSRLLRCCATIVFCVFYTAMTGGAPSTQRACIFIILKELSDISQQRRSPAIRSLHTALIIQLALFPKQISSVGFQLSYLAMTGILYINPVLQSWFPSDTPKWNPLKKIWDSAALSISCQTLTAPLAWFYFKTFPEYFLLTNLISLPLTTAVMALSVCTIMLSAAGICPDAVVTVNEAAIDLLIYVLETISRM